MKSQLILGSALAALALTGCDAIFNPVNEFRQECMGTETNRCASMLVDANLYLLDEARLQVEENKDTLVSLYGEKGYGAYNFIIEKMEEKQESLRPGFFDRHVFGDAQPFRAGRNHLLGVSEFADMHDTIKEHFSQAPEETRNASTTESMIHSIIETEQPTTAAITEQPVDLGSKASSANQLIIDSHIQDDPDRDGGEEYLDARSIVTGDFTGNGHDDIAVMYTIEGAGGSNSAFQKIALFEAQGGYFKLKTQMIVSNLVAEMTVVEGSPAMMGLLTLSYGPEDANCCPSVERFDRLRYDQQGSFVLMQD